MKPAPALFLDRDGVLNVDHSYAYRLEDMELMTNIVGALSAAVEAIPDLLLIVVTNQGGIALDYYTEAQMHEFNEELARRLHEESGGKVEIAKFYFCPHHPRSEHPELRKECDCRKPSPGMIESACNDFAIDKSRSWIIGDKTSDIEAGRRAGLAGAAQVIGAYPLHDSPDLQDTDLRVLIDFAVRDMLK